MDKWMVDEWMMEEWEEWIGGWGREGQEIEGEDENENRSNRL